MQTIKMFFYFFLYPRDIFSYYRDGYLRQSSPSPLENFIPFSLSKLEAILLSWIFVFFSSFKDLIIIVFGFSLYQRFELYNSPLGLFLGAGEHLTKMLLLATFVSAIFYPLWAIIKLLLIEVIVHFFARLFSVPSFEYKMVHDVAIGTVLSKVLLPIPLLGWVLDKLLFLYYFYLGLRYQLAFRRWQALTVILIPILLIAFLKIVLLIIAN